VTVAVRRERLYDKLGQNFDFSIRIAHGCCPTRPVLTATDAVPVAAKLGREIL